MPNGQDRRKAALSPIWAKVLRDMWLHKGRSLLVVLTIAVGVAGVGGIGQAMAVFSRAMADAYEMSRPAQITLATVPFGDENIVEELLKLPQVAAAEALSYYSLRIHAADDGSGEPEGEAWSSFGLYAIPDFRSKQIDRIFPEADAGDGVPREGELLLERLAAQYLGVKTGEPVWIETPDNERHRFRVNGTVRNPGKESATLSRIGSGYVAMETLETIGLPADYNLIVVQARGDGRDARQIEAAATAARELLRERSVEVLSTWMPEPGKHWAADIVLSMGSILQSLGGLALVAAAFLVVGTMLAILSGQLRQIGVMQVLGADSNRLMGMYMAQALIFGVLALAIGLPAGLVGAGALTGQSNATLNFDSGGYRLSHGVFALQIALGLGLPLLASYLPVLRGTRISIREAIYGTASAPSGTSAIDRIVERVRGLPRPLLLSFRNTFRQKGRLLLSLGTLGLGGAIVVSVFSVHASLTYALKQSLLYTNYDVRVTTAEPQEEEWLTEEALKLPGVVRAESWGMLSAYRVYDDGGESAELTVEALPADSEFIRPHMQEGEWLRPGEDDALVFDAYLLRSHPDLRVGDRIVLKAGDRETAWYIKGFARKMMGAPVNYITKEGLERATGGDFRASRLQLALDKHDAAAQSAAESRLRTALEDQAIAVASSELTSELEQVQTGRMSIVLGLLSAMAVLLSLVSALGLAGTMSLNVLERTREFGILSSIGAGRGQVAGIVIAEGIFLGTLGWAVGCIVAVPVSAWLCRSVGLSLYQAPLELVYSWNGAACWLAASAMLSALASLVPAWNAVRLSVREVLAYE